MRDPTHLSLCVIISLDHHHYQIGIDIKSYYPEMLET